MSEVVAHSSAVGKVGISAVAYLAAGGIEMRAGADRTPGFDPWWRW